MIGIGTGQGSSNPRDARVLFVYDRHFSTFIERDWNVVRAAFPNAELFRTGGLSAFLGLRRAVKRADLVFCWFAGRNALSSAFWNRGRKPLVMVVGGYEVACEPGIHYGLFTRFPHGAIVRRVLQRADLVIAVSQYSAQAARQNARIDPSKLQVLYHGFDPDHWSQADVRRDIDVTCIGSDEIIRKGIDLIGEAAMISPDVNFQVVGNIAPDVVRRFIPKVPSNLEFIGPLYGEDLRQHLARTRVYLQPSRHESFGCAVAEAMLMGCIPVVASETAQPEVVGDVGVFAEPLTGQGVADAVKRALALPEDHRVRARDRIVETFPLSAYAERLIGHMDALLSEHASS